MATTCTKCGASLGEKQMFCTACGARRSEPASAQPAQRYCTSCGCAIAAGNSFCNHCGARLAALTAAPAPQAAMEATVAGPALPVAPIRPSPAPSHPPQKTSKSFVFKLAIVVVVLFVLGALAMTAGVVYLGFVAKRRVAAVMESVKYNGTESPAPKQVTDPSPALSEKSAADNDGSTVSFENTDDCGRRHLENHNWIHCGAVEPNQLLERALKERQPHHVGQMRLDDCVQAYEQATNQTLSWRRSVGLSPEEMKKTYERVRRRRSLLGRLS